MDPLTLIPALLPAITDGLRGLIGRFTKGAGAKPQNVDEVIKLGQADIERLKALAELDRPPGNISTWVANMRASARYFAVYLVFAYGVTVSLVDVDPVAVNNAQQLMASAFFFLFGDRVYLSLKAR
tara:strand:+ start:196 stop:573 length:378 start_codon:yes stop_codon:yes gene_type:complete